MAPPLTARTYSTYRYNLRKRPSTQNNNNTRAVSFNDIFSSDDETRPKTSKKSKKSRDKTFKPPTPDSSSSESSDSSSSSDESDNNNDEFAEYINVKELGASIIPKAEKIDSSFFRLLKHNRLEKTSIILFIFKPGRTPLCYEFTWHKKEKRFKCLGCSVRADIFKNGKGKTFVKVSSPTHNCEARIYDPEKFQRKIIKRPFFKIIEYQCNEVLKKKLHVFDSTNFEMGYEYSWCEETSEFKCGPCANRRTVRAKLFTDENGEECIKCGKNDHVCIQRPLNEGNLGREKRMITEPNFKILSIGQKRNLIVFDSEDRTKCYKYYWSASSNTFICMGCRTREYFVYARFKTTNGNSEEENEKIIILSDTNHVCPLLDYEPIAAVAAAFERSEEIHFGFEYRTFKNGPPKIFLFLDSDKKECYEYAAILHHSEYSDKFLCIGCNGSAVRPRIISKVYLCKNANGQHFLKVLESQHTCTPRKYQPEKYSKTIVKPPNFLFCDYKDEISTKLLIFHPEGQRKHCYMYAFQREFACVQCRKKKKFLSAQVFQDEKGKECVSYKFFDHICEPLDYEKISEDCRILKNSGLIKPKKFIKNGGFEFRKNDSRSENGYLLIFDSKDKELCYKFRLNPRTRNYFCINCKEMGQQITAKLCKNKKLEIEGDEHICKPEKYEPIKNIVESSNFKVFKSKNGTDQLAIFTSDDKKIGYRYGFVKDKKSFICYACREHRPAVYAKLRQRFNGKEYVELSQSKHICKPRILNFD